MACKISPTGEDRNEPVWPAGGWFCVNAPPNESRLSCGAELECSQTEFYHTAGSTFAGLIENGRRQLQAHVRRGPITRGSVLSH